jgi:hypothetical protein
MSKIRESARGVECQVRMPSICNGNNETVVWAHCNGAAAGKGMGLKAVDPLGAYCCSACHDAIDGRKRYKGISPMMVKLWFYEGHLRSLRILIDKGLIEIK